MNIISFFAHNGEVHTETTEPITEHVDASAGTVSQTAEAVTHAAEETTGGLGALGLDWQAFLFQLIAFVIVFLLLRQFVFKKLVAVLEDRRKTVEQSIEHAAATEKKLKNAEADISKMLKDARKQADEIISTTQKESAQLVTAAEVKAAKRSEDIVAQAKKQMDNEVAKARQDLKAETAKLVATATAKIIGEKLDNQKDSSLIERALSEERS